MQKERIIQELRKNSIADMSRGVKLMDRDILIQYTDMQAEIKDLQLRIEKTKDKINKLSPVTDSVTGTRSDGTIGSISITGFPEPEYYRKKSLLKNYKNKLGIKETELLELTIKVEEYIESIDKSELRTILRLYFLDNLTHVEVAHRMNLIYPKRKIKYTNENIKKKIQRFFQNVAPCPEKM